MYDGGGPCANRASQPLPPPAPGWSVPGGASTARRLRAALDAALQLPPAAAPTPDSVASPCDSAGLPKVSQRPRMNLPTRKRRGGHIVLQFVVDTLGQPDTSTVRVLLSLGPEYMREVRRVLPGLGYTPGICDGRPMRVVVRQGFSWRMQ